MIVNGEYQKAPRKFFGKKYTYKGYTGTLRELCIRHGANYDTARTRIGRGCSIEDALRTGFNLPKHKGECITIIYDGVEMSLYEAAARRNIDYPTAIARYRAGERNVDKLLRYPKHVGVHRRYGQFEW